MKRVVVADKKHRFPYIVIRHRKQTPCLDIVVPFVIQIIIKPIRMLNEDVQKIVL